MAVNRNALIRYRTIDGCLRNRYKKWTLEDLIDACSDALYEYEGIDRGVSRRTVQTDIELGYEAPIVVTDKKYYSYADVNFTITNIPLTPQDVLVLSEAASLLKQFKGLRFSADLTEMVTKLEDKIYAQKTRSHPLVEFERNDSLRGLQWIEVIRRYMIEQRCLRITYRSFRARAESSYVFSPYLLKEYRNRWFVLGNAHLARTTLQTLAMDRIENVEDADEDETAFIPNTEINLDTYYSDVIGVTRSPNSKPVMVIFTSDHHNARYLLTKPLHPSQRVIKEDANCKTFRIDVIMNLELERELLGFGAAIEVLGPRILRKRVSTILRDAAQKYE